MANKLLLGPKLTELGPKLTFNQFEQWRSSMLYNLTLNDNFRPYLTIEFGKKTRAKPNRDLLGDLTSENTPDPEGKTAADKCVIVDMMLDQISNWTLNVIPRNDITRDCGSINEVWQKLRLFFNYETTGALLNEVWNVSREPDESPQALYSRLKQLYDDNLLKAYGLHHVDGPIVEDEELSPTLHNTIILHWLNILHPRLRDVVTQRFTTELRNSTYAKIFPEISRCINELLSSIDSESVCRTFQPRSSNFREYPGNRSNSRDYRDPRNRAQGKSRSKFCEYCKVGGRKFYQGHDISECSFLRRDSNGNSHGKSRAMDYYEDFEYFDESCDEGSASFVAPDHREVTEHVLNRVSTCASPVLPLYHRDTLCNLTLDSGATLNVMRGSKAQQLGLQIRPTTVSARMADGRTPLRVEGETDVDFSLNGKVYHMSALVADFTDADILAGTPFMTANDISIRPARGQIIIGDQTEIITYDSRITSGRGSARLITPFEVKVQSKSIILPGESLQVQVPYKDNHEVVVEPRFDLSYNCKSKESHMWPSPQLLQVSQGCINLVNSYKEPVVVKKLERVCKIYQSTEAPSNPCTETNVVTPLQPFKKFGLYSSPVSLNPHSILCTEIDIEFRDLLKEYDEVFNPTISRYNGHSGPCSVDINIGSTQPTPRRGRLPLYSKGNMEELQLKIDELVQKGIFARPQDLGVKLEYISPSFLVKKPSGGYRLVTDFTSLAPYIKVMPSMLPDINSTLLKIGSWKYLIKSDLTEAYFQIPLTKSSQKYCGIVSPFKGTFVYTTGCMGLPGTEVALEELTCRVFGDLVMLGCVAKVADDLYVGGCSQKDLLDNFRIVLHRLKENNLRLSAKKTVIAPKSTVILGWVWSQGLLEASPHRLSSLAECPKPLTVSAMKSFIGSYRFLSKVIKDYAHLLEPLELCIAGKDSKCHIQWNDQLDQAFETAQKSLRHGKAITLPRPSDVLWIVTDGSLRTKAIGATLYVVRDGVPKLGGFFSARLPVNQAGWLACEIEGIAIASALHNFAPLIRQSEHRPHILTDSKPCIQASEKFYRGEFSTSARLATFLNAVGIYRAIVGHISGKANLVSDFASRSPVSCENKSCEICKFIQELCDNVVGSVSIDDLITGKAKVPFMNRTAWISTQKECTDLEKVRFHLQQGSSPSRKYKNLKDVRRYIHSGALITNDGLIVVRESKPFKHLVDRIVVPKSVSSGLLMALHIQCSHPTSYQLKKLFNRYFFALGIDSLISSVSNGCQQCNAVKDIPHSLIEQSSCDPPDNIGFNFAADIIKRERQNILILRETVTSFTSATLIHDEKVESLRNGFITLISKIRPSSVSPVLIRVDPAPAFQSIFNKLKLSDQNIHLELGRFKNRNKNPVIDKAVTELLRELRIQNPIGGPLSSMSLDSAVATLNSRIRGPGMSAHEMWTGRDQISGEQLNFNDRELIQGQFKRRQSNHAYSEKSKAHGRLSLPDALVEVGDLVFVYSDGNKLSPRPRYIVTAINKDWVTIKKLHGGLFSNRPYQVKRTEIFKIPDFIPSPSNINHNSSDSDSSEDFNFYDVESPSRSLDPKLTLPVGNHVDTQPVERNTTVDIPELDHPGSSNTGPPKLSRTGRKIKLPAKLADYDLD